MDASVGIFIILGGIILFVLIIIAFGGVFDIDESIGSVLSKYSFKPEISKDLSKHNCTLLKMYKCEQAETKWKDEEYLLDHDANGKVAFRYIVYEDSYGIKRESKVKYYYIPNWLDTIEYDPPLPYKEADL